MPTIRVLNYETQENWHAGMEFSDYYVSTNNNQPTRGDIFRFAKKGNQSGILTTEYGGEYTEDGKEFGFWPKSEVRFIPKSEGGETDFDILLENQKSVADDWRVWGKV